LISVFLLLSLWFRTITIFERVVWVVLTLGLFLACFELDASQVRFRHGYCYCCFDYLPGPSAFIFAVFLWTNGLGIAIGIELRVSTTMRRWVKDFE
jgi:hypothetical protein